MAVNDESARGHVHRYSHCVESFWNRFQPYFEIYRWDPPPLTAKEFIEIRPTARLYQQSLKLRVEPGNPVCVQKRGF